MFNTYNMGLGMVLAVDEKDADRVCSAVKETGEEGYIVGKIVSGDRGVEIC